MITRPGRSSRFILSGIVALFVLSLVSFNLPVAPVTQMVAAAPVSHTAAATVSRTRVHPHALPSISVKDALAGHRLPAANAQPQTIGTGGAEMEISPRVVTANSGYAVVAASGFLPGETVVLYILDVQADTFAADGNGFIAFALNQFSLLIPQYAFKLIGNTSHRVAGEGIVTSSTSGQGQGAAAVPHAVRPGDPVLVVGTGYPIGGQVTLREDLNFTAVVTSSTEGNVSVEVNTDPQMPDGAVNFNLDNPGISGALQGTSVEVRADAGPPYSPAGSRTLTRAYVDEGDGPTSGAYFALGAEGFQGGETVRVTRISDNLTLANLTADSYGAAAGTVNLTATQSSALAMRMTGLSSGRQAWVTVVLDDDGIALPGAMLVPSTAPSDWSAKLLFTKLPPNTNIDILFDGNVYTSTTTDANGNISTRLTTDPGLGLDVHEVNSQSSTDSNVDIAVAARTTLGASTSVGQLTGRMSDAATTQAVTGTVTINGVTTQTTNSGNYSISNIPVGTYVMTSTAASSCYSTLTQTVSIGTGPVKVDSPLRNICITTTPTATHPPATATNTPPATNTPLPTNTPGGPTDTPAPTNTTAPTNTPTVTETPGGPTDTPAPTNTTAPTNTPTVTETPGGPTDTPTPTITPGGPTLTPTDCPNVFVDITGNVFYGAIHYLSCRHVVSGTDQTHYSPAGTSTRGQFAKVVVLGFGLTLFTPSGGSQDFTDVPPTYFAYAYIETGFANHILSGFDAGTCQNSGAQFPCYLPNRPITRGQLTKLVVNAAHYPLYTPTGGIQDFTDVPPSNVFFTSIETAYNKHVVGGYPDHTYRPNNNIRRDEMAQIVFKGITTP